MKKSKLLLTSTALLSAVSIAPVLSGCSNSLSASKKVASTTFVYNKIQYETITSNTCRVVKYVGDKPTGALSIPDTVIDSTPQLYTVTEIGPRAFESCTGLTSVSFAPDSHITKIGAKAFNYCKKLTSVTNCISLTTIDEFAFKSCAALQSIDLPQSIATIGDGAFEGCKALNSLTGHEGINVKTIGLSAFRGCSTLSTLPTMNSLENIGASAFRECAALSTITIAPSCKTIGELAFYDAGLTSLNFTEKTYWSTIGDTEDEHHFTPTNNGADNLASYRLLQQNVLTRYNKVSSITLSSDIDSPYSGEQIVMKATVNDDATSKKITWSSNPTSVATIDQDGVVTFSSSATSSQSATITATAQDGFGKTESISFTCKGSPVTSATLSETHAICFSDEGNGTQQFSANVVLKSGVTDEKYKKMVWSVENVDEGTDPLATIDDNGVLTALPGKIGVVKVQGTSAYDASVKTSSYEVCINTVFNIRNQVVNGQILRSCLGFAPNFTQEVLDKINNTWKAGDWIQINDNTVKHLTNRAFSSIDKSYYTDEIKATYFDASNLTVIQPFTGGKQWDNTRQFFQSDRTKTGLWQITKVKYPDGMFILNGQDLQGSPITDVELPASLQRLGAWTFDNCNLTNLTIRDFDNSQLAVIEQRCFAQCFNLKNLKFPKTLFLFGIYPFGDNTTQCPPLETLDFSSNVTYYDESSTSNTVTFSETDTAGNVTLMQNKLLNGHQWRKKTS